MLKTPLFAALCASTIAFGSTTTQAAAQESRNARLLVQTLSEEKTEINTLAGQQAQFLKMNDNESRRLANLWGRWIREHKAGSPLLVRLTRANGGNPEDAKILKPPVLGDKVHMLHATHLDHEAAVRTSQQRFGQTDDRAIKQAMHKRATLARKHLNQMKPYMRRHKIDGASAGQGSSSHGQGGDNKQH